ncbi:hypothetical protein ACIRPR_06450 [Streptomyces griseoflavus]|uniref:hypothetical protein n=1 Tax=Streptomyces griseoflavus TaxID=35619 RepID=UPI00381ACF9D
MTTTTAEHLRTIAVRWADLRDALASTGTTTWPPAGRMSDYLRALEEADAELAEAARWQAAYARQYLDRDPRQIGATRPPLRIEILDTMRAVQAALVACADDVAHAAQRAPLSVPAARKADYRTLREARIAHQDRQRAEQLAHADRVDPRRWRFTGTRTAPYAALWLLARVERAPGPCRRITDDEQRRIGVVAAGAAERVERALDIAARTAVIATPCPDCGGRIEMYGGAGASPAACCTACGRTWTGQDVTAAA